MAWPSLIESFARGHAQRTGIAQVFYYSAVTDDYGNVPLPEWNQKYAHSPSLRVVKVVQPDAKR